ncbi:MAG: DsrE/DsrF/DrsH-like family protein [candidate division WOR-3 bacterium]|nr:DsrE/DsrF/DrsH-like family protein [candidate division WOR-3 bacterium]
MDNKNKDIKKTTIVVQSGDYDKLYSAMIIANGSLSMGMDTTLFFTFWGLERLKRGGLSKGPLSKMNLLGLGKMFMKMKMKSAGVEPLEKMMEDFKILGGKIIACDMTMSVMGIDKKDLNEEVIDDYAGVGSYINQAKDSDINLFI